MSKRVLGIDPGLTRCGIGVVDVGSSRKLKLVEVQTIRSAPSAELADRIGSLAAELESIIVRCKPDVIAIERVFSQSNLRTVMGTAQISGVAMLLANQNKIPVVMHTPTEVKAAVTGSGRANKQQVAKMVSQLLGLTDIPKPADSADALAIAITQAWKGGVENSSNALTKAQQAWRTAELAAKKPKSR